MKRQSDLSIFGELRRQYHKKLCETTLSLRPGSNIYSIADSSSNASVELAAGMAVRLGFPIASVSVSGQTAGANFVSQTAEFLDRAFALLHHIRPGQWRFSTSQGREGISAYEQYQHLKELALLLKTNRELRSSIGGDYFITPDIVLAREPIEDSEINQYINFINPDSPLALDTPLRRSNSVGQRSILHASISCKWTIRSDRVQNTRAEALNLIRHRKGRTPHVVAVTLEPLPSRIASIALGTGDIDCTYHGALYELLEAAEESKFEDAAELLRMMREGRRLRDISDLPFDLAI